LAALYLLLTVTPQPAAITAYCPVGPANLRANARHGAGRRRPLQVRSPRLSPAAAGSAAVSPAGDRYTINEDGKEIHVLDIDHRRDIYTCQFFTRYEIRARKGYGSR
jgi:hypothetical protein